MRPRRKLQAKPEPADDPPPPKAGQPKQPEPGPDEHGEHDEEEAAPKPGLGRVLHREMVWLDGFLRRWLVRLMVIGTHASIALLFCWLLIWNLTRGRTFSDTDSVPLRNVGLVLGTVPKVDGRSNLFFTGRIQAAADLWHARKVTFLLVSGDNSRNGYDEPSEMKAALIAKGVPADRIYCDYAGLRTLDSVLRARAIFGQDDFTIISQAFHNRRALYIARRRGIPEAIAYDAPGVSTASAPLVYARELFARVMAVLDVEFLKTKPKHLGPEVRIGINHPPVDANPLPKR